MDMVVCFGFFFLWSSVVLIFFLVLADVTRLSVGDTLQVTSQTQVIWCAFKPNQLFLFLCVRVLTCHKVQDVHEFILGQINS